MMYRLLLLLPILLITTFFSQAALAAKKVYSPYVSKGEWAFENYGTYQIDDDASKDRALKAKTAIGYGVTDYLKLELEAVTKKSARSAGEDFELTAIEPVAKWQLTEKNEYFWDVGLYTALELHTDDAEDDKWEAKLLLGKKIGKWSHYTNLAFDQKYEGNDRDAEFEFTHNTAYKIDDQWKIAAEAFLDFKDMDDANQWSEQDHRIGGEVTYYIPDTSWEMKLGYLFGISESAPDGSIKWLIEYKW